MKKTLRNRVGSGISAPVLLRKTRTQQTATGKKLGFPFLVSVRYDVTLVVRVVHVNESRHSITTRLLLEAK
jgi:hypothetical protein